MEPINKQSFSERLKSYKRSPFSLFLAVIVVLSAVITLAVLAALLLYILAKGIPNIRPELFEWEYNTTNVSMMPPNRRISNICETSTQMMTKINMPRKRLIDPDSRISL